MKLILVAPTLEAAARVAARLYPGRRLLADPIPVSPAGPKESRDFGELVKRITNTRRLESTHV
ncbi:hypothetical protein [Thiocystis violacea]|uniref:hypothetical protein n=1 Tax=Thiocystis violacea TaxID=13725 RepID=UPI0019061471|nr:hypothetical protein [Thiocystis violacea]MBK1720497.1 hypothetical protein [Thiocystis violacea]